MLYTPVLKKDVERDKRSHSPIRTLLISQQKKIEILIHTQANSFIKIKLSKHLADFSNNYNTQRSSKSDRSMAFCAKKCSKVGAIVKIIRCSFGKHNILSCFLNL